MAKIEIRLRLSPEDKAEYDEAKSSGLYRHRSDSEFFLYLSQAGLMRYKNVIRPAEGEVHAEETDHKIIKFPGAEQRKLIIAVKKEQS